METEPVESVRQLAQLRSVLTDRARGRATSDRLPPGSRRSAGRPATSRGSRSYAAGHPRRSPRPRRRRRRRRGCRCRVVPEARLTATVTALLVVASVQVLDKLDGAAPGLAGDEVVERTAGMDDKISLLSSPETSVGLVVQVAQASCRQSPASTYRDARRQPPTVRAAEGFCCFVTMAVSSLSRAATSAR